MYYTWEKTVRRIPTFSTEGRKIKGRPEVKCGKRSEKSGEVEDSIT
jgi:hypothetical protein